MEREDFIFKHIFPKRGIKYAKKGHELAAQHFMATKQMQSLIIELRKAGHAICSDSKRGYYVPATTKEALPYLSDSWHRGTKIIKHTKTMMRNLTAYLGKQISIKDIKKG